MESCDRRRLIQGWGRGQSGQADLTCQYRYEGSGTTDRRWLVADQLGSVVAVTNGSGTSIAINTYDAYGTPGSTNTGRFQYTGQTWIAEIGLYDFKARFYSPTLGRFLQTDPIRYGDGLNMYAYVGNDPVNGTDPSGLSQPGSCSVPGKPVCEVEGIIVTGARPKTPACSEDFFCSNPLIAKALEPPVELSNPDWGGKILVAGDYNGNSFCPGARVGRKNEFNPDGRINSGKPGDWNTALADFDALALANGYGGRPSKTIIKSRAAMTARASPIPIYVGGNLEMHTNPKTLYLVTSLIGSGLSIRIDPRGLVRIDIPAGARLPNGTILLENETCHYF